MLVNRFELFVYTAQRPSAVVHQREKGFALVAGKGKAFFHTFDIFLFYC